MGIHQVLLFPTTVGPTTSAWDPAANPGTATLSNGNKTAVFASASTPNIRGTIGFAANAAVDKYFEITWTFASGGNEASIGLANSSVGSLYPGASNANGVGYYASTGQKLTNSTFTAYGASYASGDVIGVRLNNGVVSFYKNGSAQGNAFTLTSNSTVWFPCVGKATTTGSGTFVINTGNAAFVALPSGSSAWG